MGYDVRHPRIKASIRGIGLAGILSADIESNSYFSADRFRVQFASSSVQHDLLHIPGGELELELGDESDPGHRFVGLIDNVSYDPILTVITAEGRDLSSQLIETQTDETFANRTSSEIATLVGLRHGLLVLADPTYTAVGRYYQSEHDRTTLGQFAKASNEWDLLCGLAIREGFDLYVSGRTLRFGVPVLTDAAKISMSECVSLHLDHAIGLARPIDVLVRSWNSRTGEMAVGRSIGAGLGAVWERRITRPNLTSSMAQDQASRFVTDLKRHEWTASITVPGRADVDTRGIVLLDGTASAWDRLYWIVQASKRIDLKRGFTQTFSLQAVA